jgi:hypothetical protein
VLGRAGDSAKETCARVGSRCVMRGAKGSRTAPGSIEHGCPPRSTYGGRLRLGVAQGRTVPTFYTRVRGGGVCYLRVKVTKSRYGPQHGRSTARCERRRATAVGQWRRAGGAAWPARKHHVAQLGTHKVAHRSRWERRPDHWTRAGLSVCVRSVRRHADAAGRAQHGDVVRAGALALAQCKVALFGLTFLEFLLQK